MSLLLGATSTPVGGFRNGLGFLLGRMGSGSGAFNPATAGPGAVFPDTAYGRDIGVVAYGMISGIRE